MQNLSLSPSFSLSCFCGWMACILYCVSVWKMLPLYPCYVSLFLVSEGFRGCFLSIQRFYPPLVIRYTFYLCFELVVQLLQWGMWSKTIYFFPLIKMCAILFTLPHVQKTIWKRIRKKRVTNLVREFVVHVICHTLSCICEFLFRIALGIQVHVDPDLFTNRQLMTHIASTISFGCIGIFATFYAGSSLTKRALLRMVAHYFGISYWASLSNHQQNFECLTKQMNSSESLFIHSDETITRCFAALFVQRDYIWNRFCRFSTEWNDWFQLVSSRAFVYTFLVQCWLGTRFLIPSMFLWCFYVPNQVNRWKSILYRFLCTFLLCLGGGILVHPLLIDVCEKPMKHVVALFLQINVMDCIWCLMGGLLAFLFGSSSLYYAMGMVFFSYQVCLPSKRQWIVLFLGPGLGHFSNFCLLHLVSLMCFGFFLLLLLSLHKRQTMDSTVRLFPNYVQRPT